MASVELKVAPWRVLVVEGFAGSYPVAKYFEKEEAEREVSAESMLVGYVGFEQRSDLAAAAPHAQQLGLSPHQYLNLSGAGGTGDVTSTQLQTQVVGFVTEQLRLQQVDLVVVFGGPPCTMYSCARPDTRTSPRRAVAAAEAALKTAVANESYALKRLADEQQAAAAGQPAVSSPVLAVMRASVDKRKAERAQAERDHLSAVAAAEQAEQEHDCMLQRSDDVVKAFLSLYQSIKALCEAVGGVQCCLFMENPESNAMRGLLNRDFPKSKYLAQLPTSPAGRQAAKVSFMPAQAAFLCCVRQNWGSYAADQPQKRTIIFTDALGPDGQPTLTELTCPGRCLVQPDTAGGRDHVRVDQARSSKQRAAWPHGFVEAALRAAVLSMHARLHANSADAEASQLTPTKSYNTAVHNSNSKNTNTSASSTPESSSSTPQSSSSTPQSSSSTSQSSNSATQSSSSTPRSSSSPNTSISSSSSICTSSARRALFSSNTSPEERLVYTMLQAAAAAELRPSSTTLERVRQAVMPLRRHLKNFSVKRAAAVCFVGDGALLVLLGHLLGSLAELQPPATQPPEALEKCIGLLKDVAVGLAASKIALSEAINKASAAPALGQCMHSLAGLSAQLLQLYSHKAHKDHNLNAAPAARNLLLRVLPAECATQSISELVQQQQQRQQQQRQQEQASTS